MDASIEKLENSLGGAGRLLRRIRYLFLERTIFLIFGSPHQCFCTKETYLCVSVCVCVCV